MTCYQFRKAAKKAAIVAVAVVGFGVPVWVQWQLVLAVRELAR